MQLYGATAPPGNGVRGFRRGLRSGEGFHPGLHRAPHPPICRAIDIWPDDWAASLWHRRAHVQTTLSKHRRTGRVATARAVHVQATVKGHAHETGTVKWYNETKGYGFIQPDNGGKDVFVHATALERAGMRGLREGQKISYELQTDQRTGKTSAVNLQAA